MMNIKKIAHLTGHSGAIYCLAYFKDNRFFSGGFDNLVVEWDVDNPEIATAVVKLNSKAISLLYLEDKNWLVAGQSTGGVHIVDLASRKEIHLLQGHQEMVFALFYDKEGDSLYVGASDGKISVWNMTTMNCDNIHGLGYGKLRDIKIVDDLLYVGTESGAVVILDKDFNEVDLISEHQENFSVNTLFFENGRLLTGSRDGHLNELKNVGDGFQLIQKIPAHNFAIYKIIKSPKDTFFATASRDKSIKIWNASDLSFVQKIDFKSLKGHIGSVNDLLWFKEYIVSVSDDRSVIVWKTNNN